MTTFFIIISILALAYYPISEMTSILVMLFAVCGTFLCVKDKEASKKVLQPAVLLGTVFCFDTVFTLFNSFLRACGSFNTRYYSTDLYDFNNDFANFISLVCIIAVVAFVVLVVVFFALKKDVPVVGKMVGNMVDGKPKKEKKVEKTSEPVKEDVTTEEKKD